MRRAKKNQIDSIVFDDHARLEFLTGFRKRKLMKKEAAKNKAKECERLERLQARKETRRALKERAQENARLVEGACKQNADIDESDDEKADGFVTPDKGKGKATQEFEDEEQLATVTIVEEFDPEALRHGNATRSTNAMNSQINESPERLKTRAQSFDHEERDASSIKHKNKPSVGKAKRRPEEMAYETKAARKAARPKQLARKLEKADRAGRKTLQRAVKRTKRTNR